MAEALREVFIHDWIGELGAGVPKDNEEYKSGKITTQDHEMGREANFKSTDLNKTYPGHPQFPQH